MVPEIRTLTRFVNRMAVEAVDSATVDAIRGVAGLRVLIASCCAGFEQLKYLGFCNARWI
jgi:hypothetical protein